MLRRRARFVQERLVMDVISAWGEQVVRYPSAMAVATDPFLQKTDEQQAIIEMVRQFVDEQIIPNAEHYDGKDEFPEPIVEQMKELGLFGITVPEEFGGLGLDLTTYTMVVEELSRGWISISGIINTHFIGTYLLLKFGTDEQKQKYLPAMATGELRAAFSLSEPELGSDVQAIKTSAKKVDDDHYEVNGQKMWVTNGLRSGIVFTLVKTDPDAEPRHKGMTCFICEKEPGVGENTGDYAGFTVPPQLRKMGYKGVESTELVFDGYRVPAENVLGGEEAGLNKGFAQMMDALEVGRVNVAARGVGLAQRALELALKYSQERRTFGKPIAEHQAIQFKLADMATQLDAARMLTLRAARMKDAGERSDLEAGMAKLFASETGRFCAEECLRIHGGYGYSKEYEIERIYRDAPLLLIGEGTSEIQKMVIGKKLLQRHALS
jgi:alkylation response protein AidB-like acyl-CoA dehydrogenase